MAILKIFSIEFDFPHDSVEYIRFESDHSLSDADIIIYTPSFGVHHTDQGRTEFDEDDSSQIRKFLSHWEEELNQAYSEGKTIFVMLSPYDRARLSWGRSLPVENRFYEAGNYQPLGKWIAEVIPKRGKKIIKSNDGKTFSGYWASLSNMSSYRVFIEGDFNKIIFTTRAGDIVGAIASKGKGNIVFLPYIEFDIENYIVFKEGETEGEWSDNAIIFGKKFVQSLVEIDKVLRSEEEASPAPEWVTEVQYMLVGEDEVTSRLNDVKVALNQLSEQQSNLEQQLQREAVLRNLLYETGHALEEAILVALRLLGFEADTYIDSESEFDAIFVSEEGRFLGEVEGRDTKAINIDKLSQLERNVQEDFAKEDVLEPAKGILFGNAYRITPPQDRPAFFTDKCLSGARRSRIALIRTPDLFQVAKYLKGNSNPSYAQECRQAIKNTEGDIVVFPPPPTSGTV